MHLSISAETKDKILQNLQWESPSDLLSMIGFALNYASNKFKI